MNMNYSQFEYAITDVVTKVLKQMIPEIAREVVKQLKEETSAKKEKETK